MDQKSVQKPLLGQPSDSQLTPEQNSAQEVLRPELQPIADRHGRELMEFSIRVAGANTALDVLLVATRHNMALRSRVAALMDAQTFFCAGLAEAKGWTWPKVLECIGDIGRAAKLARTPGVGPDKGH